MPTFRNGLFQNSTVNESMRKAVVCLLCAPSLDARLPLTNLSPAQWKDLLRWLDISGLALYFFDCIVRLKLLDLLPHEVVERLHQNLADNTERIRLLKEESAAIHKEFQRAGLAYVALKGFSLFPESVPTFELRSQLDLDFLVAEESSLRARSILESRGYNLHAIGGRSWEFKANQAAKTSLKDLYKPTGCRCVELHVEATQNRSPLIGRSVEKIVCGVTMPVLAPPDLFLGQALHLYKHILRDFFRASHLFELFRHIQARYADHQFWSDVQSAANENPTASFGLGLVICLISSIKGQFAPSDLTLWTVDELPRFARLWVKFYGQRVAFSDFPGTKLNLLLQREMAAMGVSAKRTLRSSLLPLRFPPPIIQADQQETNRERIQRWCVQFRFILFRLRFHTGEGLRFGFEYLRWKKVIARLADSSSSMPANMAGPRTDKAMANKEMTIS